MTRLLVAILKLATGSDSLPQQHRAYANGGETSERYAGVDFRGGNRCRYQ
jgi:hypothetical protein